MIYIGMDMGTSNTRLWLCEGERVLGESKAAFGAKFGKMNGKKALFEQTGAQIRALLTEAGISETDVECVVVSGMGGSEMGLCEIPHISLPADCYSHANALTRVCLPEVTSIPMVFIPGIKAVKGDKLCDIIRGEETEIYGLLEHLPAEPCVLLLPGTHNKIVRVGEDGTILDFVTTLSGEVLDMVMHHSILCASVDYDFTLQEAFARRGMDDAEKNGLNAALFQVRLLEKNGHTRDEMTSFLFGAVLGDDARLIRSLSAGKKVYVGGREGLKKVYCALLDEAIALPEAVCDHAVRRGQAALLGLYHRHAAREEILSAIEKEKLIAIVRSPKEESFLDAMKALYEGGIRLAEITYDRSGKIPKEETARLIETLSRKYAGKMHVGAGTVTTVDEVLLTYKAGGSFIISPNMDPKIISLTRKLGLVSIPAAFTPTEIAGAMDAGADYVKLFPADQLGEGYVRAVKAPLSDAKLLAVGGVNEKNAGSFLKKGFCGVGVGSGIYNHALIEKGDFKGLKALAETFVCAMKEEV